MRPHQNEDWPDQTDIAYFMPMLEAEAEKCGVIIELGCGHGNGSTRAFARGLARSKRTKRLMISVDQDPDRPQCRPDLEPWIVWHGETESEQTVRSVYLRLQGWIPDILFIDTDHTKDQLTKELAAWHQITDHQTKWLFHDTWMNHEYNPMVEAIHEFIAANPQYEYTELSKESHGMGMMRWRPE